MVHQLILKCKRVSIPHPDGAHGYSVQCAGVVISFVDIAAEHLKLELLGVF